MDLAFQQEEDEDDDGINSLSGSGAGSSQQYFSQVCLTSQSMTP